MLHNSHASWTVFPIQRRPSESWCNRKPFSREPISATSFGSLFGHATNHNVSRPTSKSRGSCAATSYIIVLSGAPFVHHVSFTCCGIATLIAPSALICPLRTGTGSCVLYVLELTSTHNSSSLQLV